MQQPSTLPDVPGRNLAGDTQDRRRTRIGGRETRHRVQQSRSGNRQADTDAVGGSSIPVGHVGYRLLVPSVIDCDRVTLKVQRVERPVELNARQAEYYIDPLGLEGLH